MKIKRHISSFLFYMTYGNLQVFFLLQKYSSSAQKYFKVFNAITLLMLIHAFGGKGTCKIYENNLFRFIFLVCSEGPLMNCEIKDIF